MDKWHWLDEWKLKQCDRIFISQAFLVKDESKKCLTPDGFVHCDVCRYLTKRYANYYHVVI